MSLSKQFYYKNNRLQQLRGFCYAVQTGSMAKCAEKLGLSQSAITLQIQSLERDLETKLFKRNGKEIKLTEDGKEFYDYAIPVLQKMEALFENFANKKSKKHQNSISIGGNIVIFHILPKYIKKFEDLHPKVNFSIKNLTRPDAIERVKNGDLDMAIYSMRSNNIPSELDFIPIARHRPILLTHKDHPLAKKEKFSLGDIKKRNVHLMG